MDNRVKIKRRGKRRYYSTEIPLQYREAGEGRKELMATTREALAEKYEQEIEQRRQGLDRDAGKTTLGEYLTERFLPFYRHEVEPQTWYDYRLHIETQIVPLIGRIRLDKLTTRDVDQWIVTLRSKLSERTKKPLSDRTIEYIYAVLRRALQFAVDWRFITANPASARGRAAKRRKKVRVSPIRFLTPEQAKRFVETVRADRLEALYLLALTTGMREGELLGLKWTDLDLDGSRLTVNHSLAHTKRRKGDACERITLKGPKNVGSRRTIELPEITLIAMREHAKHQNELQRAAGEHWKDEGYVFTSRLGKPLDRGNALHRFQEILKDNALPKIRFCDLRHTHASLLIAEGVHAKKIAERLGHSSIKLTMDTYGHLFEGSDRDSAERMDQIFGGKKSDGLRRVTEAGTPLIMIPGGFSSRHADKNADKTVRLEIQKSVSA